MKALAVGRPAPSYVVQVCAGTCESCGENTVRFGSVVLSQYGDEALIEVLGQDNTNAQGFMLWPDSQGNVWRFAMASADPATGSSYDQTLDINSNANVQLNTWTQLTASYNAATGQLNLYVNGALAGTGQHKPFSSAAGSFAIGRGQNGGNKNVNYFNGSISNVSATTGAITPGVNTCAIAVSSATTKCLDNNVGGTSPGNPVQIWDCNNSNPQQWAFNPDGTLRVNGGCLDTVNEGTQNNTLVQYATCAPGVASQQWFPRGNGSIYNPASGRCLDDPAGNIASGTRPQLYDCNGTPSQRWTVTSG
ncbi:hypothetical protein C7C46_27115 [Streptomyces tateyamensis]|uniref:Ricin B lectin domain-containing protein n=1 Tax=Streptomyces tateyamensis TaxID=565073 RepID=A0A2V4MVJ8_9ACTN|nr:ricin-type beta-trefoil lectin domain protein [Streptomyces tateyamensis]PYC71010.1 hypothetical protein C7C46_27115 [Streptomyces tateyamensis]